MFGFYKKKWMQWACVLCSFFACLGCDSLVENTGGNTGGSAEEPNEPEEPICILGESDCGCRNGNACDEGLVCMSGYCEQSVEQTGRIQSPGSRACEFVLVEQTDVKVGKVTFAESVKGVFQKRGKRTAVSMISREDVDIAANAFEAQLVGGDASDQNLRIEQARCFNRLGQLIESDFSL